MNIEEAKITLNWQLELADKENKEILNLFDKEAIRTLLTAYEEKGEKCDFLDKELYNVNQEIQKLQINIQKEKEKNKKIENELEKHIKFCEQEAEGSLNNEVCHISLKFNKKLLNILKEEE